MFRQCVAGILAGVLLLLSLMSSVPTVVSADDGGATVQVEARRLAEAQTAEIVAGSVNWWAVAGTTLACAGVIVAVFSGIALVGTGVAFVAGAATAGEVVFAGQALLLGLGAAVTGSTICDSAGC